MARPMKSATATPAIRPTTTGAIPWRMTSPSSRKRWAPIAGCPNHQGANAGHALPVGIICRRRRVALEHGAHLGDNSDQSLRLIVFAHETPAHRIGLPGP